ncbi:MULTISPECIES: hypothetical protein [Kamptonema]|uniref:hypothetical protein n=1 Tax=Kamptonema TaxID=1501433 RepID=UPI0001DAC63F|nr:MULTISPECIES: hypothetical protein [Kamptonema]CBN53778.1 hypothetical protein OSCI_240006 [Kamptonema sp. PCC 6506]
MVYQKRVNCFIEVLKNQSDLFTEKDRIELAEIINQIPEDDDETIWQAISHWLQLHPNVKEAHNINLKNTESSPLPDKHLGPGGSKPEKSPDKPTGEPTVLQKLKNEINPHNPLDPPKQSP